MMSNKEQYIKYKEEHTSDGGKHPVAYAVTEMIKQGVLNKTYKIYYGGGYEYNTDIPIDNYDVVAVINFGGDPTFFMCANNDEGDCCDLVKSNPVATLEYIVR